jgi:cytochrome c oxidase subunit 2
VPALRVKRDVVPGMYTSLWFEPTRRGTYDIFCTEYCGDPEALHDPDSPTPFVEPTAEQIRRDNRPQSVVGHSGMLSRIHIVSRREFNEYYDALIDKPAQYETYAAWGEALFSEAGRCTACHVVQPGAPRTTGPNLSNVVGYPQPLEGGGEAMADLEYIRRSLREPNADIVRGFPPVMSSFASLHELQIDALAAYLASISDQGSAVNQEIERLHAEQNQ